MRKTILILLSILTFYGCRYNVPPSVKEALSTAEAYMEENPDSALHILQNISHPENLRSQARADYALLYTQACDKTHLLPPTDSLLLSEISDNRSESTPNLRNMATNLRRSFRKSSSASRFVMVRAEYFSFGKSL